MVAIPLDRIDYNKVFKYVNVLILEEFYPKTKNVSYYLKFATDIQKWKILIVNYIFVLAECQ